MFPSQLKHQGAMLAFTVMDHDVVFQNDFGGEALFSLAAVPGISGEDMSGFEALNVVDLPLMHPITTSKAYVANVNLIIILTTKHYINNLYIIFIIYNITAFLMHLQYRLSRKTINYYCFHLI